MKKALTFFILFILLVFSDNSAFAVNLCDTHSDPENHTWTADWTDIYGETTYTLEAPCKVFLTIPFSISATVTDSIYPLTTVGFNWSILDTPEGGIAETLADGSGDWIWLNDLGAWEYNVSVTYTGLPVDHTIEFSFTDFGHGSGFHNAEGSSIGDITVDRTPA
jgi:hypothetical protein